MSKIYNKWFKLFVIILGASAIYRLSYLKDAFYVPMRENFGLTNTQIGLCFTVLGIVQTSAYIPSGWLAQRFSARFLIPLSLIGTGCLGFYYATFPPFPILLVMFALFGIFTEGTYWPIVLKSVRLLGDGKQQGRLFGFFESGRGLTETIIAFVALAVFKAFGEGGSGLRAAIYFFCILMIAVGIFSIFTIQDDTIKKGGNQREKNKLAFKEFGRAIKTKEVWLVACNTASVYILFTGITFFVPFLQDIYALPVTLAGIYGVVNMYVVRMFGGAIGGVLADKVLGSSTKYMNRAFIVLAILAGILLIIPSEKSFIYVVLIITLLFSLTIMTMRGVFFAPMEEVKVPREISGAAMAIGSFIGYSPAMFGYTMYGWLLDRTPGAGGYKIVFSVMIVLAFVGFFISSRLWKAVKNKMNEQVA